MAELKVESKVYLRFLALKTFCYSKEGNYRKIEGSMVEMKHSGFATAWKSHHFKLGQFWEDQSSYFHRGESKILAPKLFPLSF